MKDSVEYINIQNPEPELNLKNINRPTEVVNNDKWTGYVIDNNDPLRLGRVQVRIIGIYDDLADYLLPWAVPDIGFVGTMRGSFMIPEKDTLLRGYFDKGDVQRPVYDSIAYSKNSMTSNRTGRTSDTEYPNKIVFFETNDGDFLTLNRATGELVFTHRTGAQMHVSTNGDITIDTGLSLSPGNLNINVRGNSNITVDGKVNVNGKKGVNINASYPSSQITLGNNQAKQLVNNFTNCVICGAAHSIGNTQVKV